MKEYEISIVTPFHDVDEEVFVNGIKSMRSQSIGFGNIEWIVVIHNSTNAHKEYVHRYLDEYENVKVYDLDNDRKTPSSPRNYGLKHATGRYVGFLDADDSYTRLCLEKVLSVIKKYDAQVVSFRREYELESPDGIPVTEIVLWDQMQEEILIDREHWDDEKMFSGLCGMVTSRIYDRVFLEQHGITFDESVLFGEDFLFNLTVYGQLERVVYLPQFIGYHYYINGKSLVQSGDKSPELLITYAQGYTKIFDMGLKHGFFMNSIISRLCVVLSRFLVANKTMTLEQRCEIRDMLAPYIQLTKPLNVSKVFSEKAVKEAYEVPRDVIMHPEKWVDGDLNDELLVSSADPRDNDQDIMLRTLTRILEMNQNTDYGRHYSFGDIMTVEGYRSRLPITEYSDYRPLIQLTTRVGEKNIFTSSEILSYIITFQPDGEERATPCVNEQAVSYANILMNMLSDRNTLLMYKSLPKHQRFNDSVYANTVAGTALNSLMMKMMRSNMENSMKTTSPLPILFPSEIGNIGYLRLLFALMNRDVEQIVSPLAWDILEMFALLREKWEQLCDDIENGTISERDDFSDEYISHVAESLVPDKSRADELRAVFEAGFDRPVAKRIWPKLRVIYADHEGDQGIYAQMLRNYTGGVSCINPFFETNGLIVGETDADYGYKLMNTAGFFEFIPENSDDLDQTISIDQLCEGELYELVITTVSGFYRLRTRDVIRIKRVKAREVHFSFAYHRYDDKIIHLNEMVMAHIVNELADMYGLLTPDYAYTESDEKLTVLIEPSAMDIDRIRPINRQQMASDLTYLLKNNHVDISDVEVMFSAPETHKLYRDILRFKNRQASDEIRPIHYLSSEESRKFFFLNTIEQEKEGKEE